MISERRYASMELVSIVDSCTPPEMLCDEDDPDVIIMEESHSS